MFLITKVIDLKYKLALYFCLIQLEALIHEHLRQDGVNHTVALTYNSTNHYVLYEGKYVN